MGSIFLPEHTNRRSKNDIGHIKDGQHQVVLIAMEVEVLVHVVGLCIAEISFVEGIAQVHEGQHGQDSQVKFEYQGLFMFVCGEMLTMALQDRWIVVRRIGGRGMESILCNLGVRFSVHVEMQTKRCKG